MHLGVKQEIKTPGCNLILHSVTLYSEVCNFREAVEGRLLQCSSACRRRIRYNVMWFRQVGRGGKSVLTTERGLGIISETSKSRPQCSL
jgi:hypothetical protein